MTSCFFLICISDLTVESDDCLTKLCVFVFSVAVV